MLLFLLATQHNHQSTASSPYLQTQPMILPSTRAPSISSSKTETVDARNGTCTRTRLRRDWITTGSRTLPLWQILPRRFPPPNHRLPACSNSSKAWIPCRSTITTIRIQSLSPTHPSTTGGSKSTRINRSIDRSNERANRRLIDPVHMEVLNTEYDYCVSHDSHDFVHKNVK